MKLFLVNKERRMMPSLCRACARDFSAVSLLETSAAFHKWKPSAEQHFFRAAEQYFARAASLKMTKGYELNPKITKILLRHQKENL